ncbi:hypothetical protein ESY86_11245 [Subsaximicrobium wynnwilliamsii]|uniref:Cytochrome C oxidase subunit I n=1 Tax=Subsaximicrobium wynnwilliamsii TaxID=291179 RepID=A0A5C6ZHP1_9FLAO|nr:hypothetical protein [Subsaximicrobium wynnwilliamsii]TXD83063.1 hypothetical protein ESY87_11280 [Subsaximicrobium wynnwilliamsii]TXD88807.1 hypothetical protein ESY86_11245 [Subsaximicrobium wynnwilliamsii]TXE02880.1 hypothetical protein ESY88_10300 [Subsaximicrobium wynnwilliamsii]
MPKRLVIICLINFLVAALMGLALRYSFIAPIGLNYRFLTHAHSHVAMLGWVYLMLYLLIVHYFIPNELPRCKHTRYQIPKKTNPKFQKKKEKRFKHLGIKPCEINKPVFTRLFWVTQLSVVGMMLSFPVQGYAAISITFSTLHIFCSYYFVYLVWTQQQTKSKATQYLLKAALLFMVISTIGVWCLGPAAAILGQASAFFQIAIQFFLHFQFNGWFLIAVLAVFFHLLEIEYSTAFKRFFVLLISATVLTFALPLQWFAPFEGLLLLNAIGVILQMATLIAFLKLIRPKLYAFFQFKPPVITNLYRFALICVILKIVLPVITLLPSFANVLFSHRNFIIGFIHLVMLGIISSFLLAFISQMYFRKMGKTLNFGIYSFLLGIFLTEILLAIQGYQFYFGKGILLNYYAFLFSFSILLPLGLFLFIYKFISSKTHERQTSKTP